MKLVTTFTAIGRLGKKKSPIMVTSQRAPSFGPRTADFSFHEVHVYRTGTANPGYASAAVVDMI